MGLLAASLVGGVARADDWASQGGDLVRARVSAERAGGVFDGGRWTFALPDGVTTISSPAVAEGYVVFGASDGVVRALRATDGTLLWERRFDDAVGASPTIDKGRVFVPSADTNLYALHLSDGSVIWKKNMGGLEAAAPVVTDGGLLLPAGAPLTSIVKIDAATGATLWETPRGIMVRASFSSAAVTPELLIVATNAGRYHAFDLKTGYVRWTFATDGDVTLSSPMVRGDTAYFLPGGPSHRVYAVAVATGRPLAGWPRELPLAAPDIDGIALSRSHAVSSLSRAGGQLLLDVRTDDAMDTDGDAQPDHFLLREHLFALDATAGTVTWQRDNGRKVVTDPSVIPPFWLCPTPAIYQASAGGQLAIVASSIVPTVSVVDPATGAGVSSLEAMMPSQASPVLANGRLVVGTQRGVEGFLSRDHVPPAAPALGWQPGAKLGAEAPVLTWTPVEGAEGDAVTYQVRIDADGEVLESWRQEVVGTSAQMSVQLPSDLPSGTTYAVGVRARDAHGAWSGWSSSTFVAAAPDALPPVADPTPSVTPDPAVTPAPTVGPDAVVAPAAPAPAPTTTPTAVAPASPTPAAAPAGTAAAEPQGGCSVTGNGGSSGALGGISLLGLASVLARRKRRA